MREYTQDKKKCKSPCCMDCFQTAEQKKEERKLDHTEYCHICQSSFIACRKYAPIQLMMMEHIELTTIQKLKKLN